MKTPLQIVYDQFDKIIGVQAANGAWVHTPELVALANAHAAVPGPPREDGVWEILDLDGYPNLVNRYEGQCVIDLGNGTIKVDDAKIVAHRKHIPLEVPQ